MLDLYYLWHQVTYTELGQAAAKEIILTFAWNFRPTGLLDQWKLPVAASKFCQSCFRTGRSWSSGNVSSGNRLGLSNSISISVPMVKNTNFDSNCFFDTHCKKVQIWTVFIVYVVLRVVLTNTYRETLKVKKFYVVSFWGRMAIALFILAVVILESLGLANG